MDTFNLQATRQTDTFFCGIDGDTIVQYDQYRGSRVIGKTLEAYNELEQTTTEYYNKLVELGVIVPPKTPEEQNKELQETLAKMSELMLSMQNEIKELKQNGFKRNSFNGGENLPECKPERRCSESATDDTGDK